MFTDTEIKTMTHSIKSRWTNWCSFWACLLMAGVGALLITLAFIWAGACG